MDTDIITIKVQYEEQSASEAFYAALEAFLQSHCTPQLVAEIKSVE